LSSIILVSGLIEADSYVRYTDPGVDIDCDVNVEGGTQQNE